MVDGGLLKTPIYMAKTMSGICPLSPADGGANLEDEFIEFFSLGIRQTRKFSTYKKKWEEKRSQIPNQTGSSASTKNKDMHSEKWGKKIVKANDFNYRNAQEK